MWEEPPDGRGRTTSFLTDNLVSTLKANPQRWARVRTWTSKSSAGSATARFRAGVYGPGWEWKARRHGDGSALYLRWVGIE